MKKILVTTDFSVPSKAGIRFALQMASQMEAELVFFHCFQVLTPTTIYRERIDQAVKQQTALHLKKLEKFVADIRKGMKIERTGPCGYAVVEGSAADWAIMEYARDNRFDYICMSTRGAGTLRKLIGTHTGTVILTSSVPVLAIPHTYRTQALKKILYASDLENFDAEMAPVAELASAIGIKVDLVHFYYPGQIALDKTTLTAMWKKKFKTLDKVWLSMHNIDKSFASQLDDQIRQAKPSLVVFFSRNQTTWYDKLFGYSHAETYSYAAKTPMLAYRKL